MLTSCLLTLLLSGCVTAISSGIGAGASVTGAYFDYLSSKKGEPVIVTPPLVDYSADVQSHAADEMDKLSHACPRDAVTPACSALARMIADYGTLREKIRAAQPK